MFVSSQNSYFETLISNVMIFGDEAFGGVTRSWEWSPHEGLRGLIRRHKRAYFLSLSSKDRVRRQPFANQKESLHQ